MRKLEIWEGPNRKLGIVEPGGLLIDGKIRNHVYCENERLVLDIDKDTMDESTDGEWRRVAQIEQEWPDIEWEYIRCSKAVANKIRREFGFE